MSSGSVAAVVLAAGQSRRMAGRNKLTEVVAGVAVVRRVLDAVVGAAAVGPVIVVVDRVDGPVWAACAGVPGVAVAVNHRADQGIGGSVSAGAMAAMGLDVEGTMFIPGDLALLRAIEVQRVAEVFLAQGGVVRTQCDGQPGHPLVVPQERLVELLTLDADEGAMAWVRSAGVVVTFVDIAHRGVVFDVDDEGRLAEARDATNRGQDARR